MGTLLSYQLIGLTVTTYALNTFVSDNETSWQSTTDFIPINSSHHDNYGHLRLWEHMSVSLDVVFHSRTCELCAQWESIFRVGFPAYTGDEEGAESRYPSLWIDNSADRFHMALSQSNNPLHGWDFGEVILEPQQTYSVDIEWTETWVYFAINDNALLNQPRTNPTKSSHIGKLLNVFVASDSPPSLTYIIANVTLKNIEMVTTPPTKSPTTIPTSYPTEIPTSSTATPTHIPTVTPTDNPTKNPTTATPTTITPSQSPTVYPTTTPTKIPSIQPTSEPTHNPNTKQPTTNPTYDPTSDPTYIPSLHPTIHPTSTVNPSSNPSDIPSSTPTDTPSSNPSANPISTVNPSSNPTDIPSSNPTTNPTSTVNPSSNPTDNPSSNPTVNPTTIATTENIVIAETQSQSDINVLSGSNDIIYLAVAVCVGCILCTLMVVIVLKNTKKAEEKHQNDNGADKNNQMENQAQIPYAEEIPDKSPNMEPIKAEKKKDISPIITTMTPPHEYDGLRQTQDTPVRSLNDDELDEIRNGMNTETQTQSEDEDEEESGEEELPMRHHHGMHSDETHNIRDHETESEEETTELEEEEEEEDDIEPGIDGMDIQETAPPQPPQIAFKRKYLMSEQLEEEYIKRAMNEVVVVHHKAPPRALGVIPDDEKYDKTYPDVNATALELVQIVDDNDSDDDTLKNVPIIPAPSTGTFLDAPSSQMMDEESITMLEIGYEWITLVLLEIDAEHWREYVDNFKSHGVTESRLGDLSPQDLKTLIPDIGPRNDFEKLLDNKLGKYHD